MDEQAVDDPTSDDDVPEMSEAAAPPGTITLVDVQKHAVHQKSKSISTVLTNALEVLLIGTTTVFKNRKHVYKFHLPFVLSSYLPFLYYYPLL